jgi:hypothetical protein
MPHSKEQRTAARIALAVKKGNYPKSRLKGASLSMYKSMSISELEDFAHGKIKK